ncbi:hypothetical protein [Xanthomonas sp. SI]|uniref:hypothetical protein n=1 Tax=Xanthomonas sp. SI TaxID=2724123 RepID=UPI001639EA97|nr:hypothetical protein [Xanthomonas sp. SI]
MTTSTDSLARGPVPSDGPERLHARIRGLARAQGQRGHSAASGGGEQLRAFAFGDPDGRQALIAAGEKQILTRGDRIEQAAPDRDHAENPSLLRLGQIGAGEFGTDDRVGDPVERKRPVPSLDQQPRRHGNVRHFDHCDLARSRAPSLAPPAQQNQRRRRACARSLAGIRPRRGDRDAAFAHLQRQGITVDVPAFERVRVALHVEAERGQRVRPPVDQRVVGLRAGRARPQLGQIANLIRVGGMVGTHFRDFFSRLRHRSISSGA